MATVHIITQINFGCGISTAFSIEGKKALCLISQSANSKNKIVNLIGEQLMNNRVEVIYVNRSGGEPTSDEVDRLVADTPDDIDAVIGVGGGSVLDIAKYVAMLKVSGGLCADYEFASNQISGTLPTYLIPTTSGSGSEVTQYSVIQNSNTGRKFTIASPILFPRVAYIDPELTVGLPLYTSIASGLDAFIHCLEAYLNTSSNPILRPLAIEGMRLAVTYLPRVVNEPHNLEVRTKLSLASSFGGMCIANSRTGLIHTLSVAVSEYSDEAHGILNARMLPHALQFNLLDYAGDLKNFVNCLDVIKVNHDDEAAEWLIHWVGSLLDELDLLPLNAQILRAEQDHLVDRVLQDKGLFEVNHRPINGHKIKQIFEVLAI